MKIVAGLLLLTACCVAQQIPVSSFVWQGRTWKIETVLRIIDSDCTSSSPCFGTTYCSRFSDDHRRRLVRIVYQPPDWETQQEIMFHELQHVVEGCTDLKTTQHHAIYGVSQPMVRLLSDPQNRNLMQWLFGGK